MDISSLAGSILKNQEETFAAELHRLKQQPLFNLMDFESVIDWIRSTVAEVRQSVGQRTLRKLFMMGRSSRRTPTHGGMPILQGGRRGDLAQGTSRESSFGLHHCSWAVGS